MTTRHSSYTRTVAPPPAPEASLLQRARRLPLSGPGIVVTVPLSLLPAYLELHGLVPFTRNEIRKRAEQGIRKPDGVLLVKRIRIQKAETTK